MLSNMVLSNLVLSKLISTHRVLTIMAIYGCLGGLVFAQLPARYESLAGDANFEAALLQATNQARATQGIGVLEPQPQLALAARQHAAEMARLGYLSHESPNPQTALLPQRVAAAGSPLQIVGENLVSVSNVSALDSALAADIVAGWLDSPRHRENLLRADYSHVGFGASLAGGEVYVAQVFAYQPLNLTAADVSSQQQAGFEVTVTLELTSPQTVLLNYGRANVGPQDLAGGRQVLRFITEQTDSVALGVGVRSPTGAGFILQDEGWLDLAASSFRSGQTPPRDSVRISEVTSRSSTLTTYAVRLQFTETPPPQTEVWLEGEGQAAQVLAGHWQGRTFSATVNSQVREPVIDFTVNRQVVLSMALDFGAGRPRLTAHR
jgi:uncharacterized protein YkwD